MIVLHYGSLTSRFCQNGFRSLLPVRRPFRSRGSRHPKLPQSHPLPRGPRPPSEPSVTGRNLRRMGLFTVLGVGGAFSLATELESADLKERWRPRADGDQPNGFVKRIWASMPTLTAQRLLYGIAGSCLVIFLGWRVPALTGFMSRHFVSSVKSSAPISALILSTYSHQHPLHLLFNMLCFGSFYDFMRRRLPPKQMLFFCWSAGLVTGCGSALINSVFRGSVASLGFSGVLLATLAYMCVRDPETRFSLFFVGNFKGEHLLPCIVVFDLCGLLLFRKASFIDHASHLVGVGFGAFYAKMGQQLYTQRVLSLAGRQ